MKLDKQQKLFLHGVVFSYLSSCTDEILRDEAGKIFEELQDALLEHDAEEEYEEEESSLEENGDSVFINKYDVVGLDQLKTGKGSAKERLEFNVQKEKLNATILDATDFEVDELLDVTIVKRYSQRLDIKSSSGWTSFYVEKFPKSWTSSIPTGTLIKIGKV